MKNQLKVINGQGQKIAEESLDVVSSAEDRELLTLYLRSYLFGQRKGQSKVKTRGEVSGGGKKPWRQKGTGRARAGSTRAPTWVHGGKVHGPTPRDYSKDFPVAMKKNALASALSLKDGAGCISIWEISKLD